MSWTLDCDDPTPAQRAVYLSGSIGSYWKAAYCWQEGATLEQGTYWTSLEPAKRVTDAHMARRFR